MRYNRFPTLVMSVLLWWLPLQLGQAQPASVEPASIKTPWTTELQAEWLHQVLPEADRFSEKAGDPPVFRGYKRDAEGDEQLAGFAFLSADVPPEEVGYSAPIAMLIGLSTGGHLTGLKVLTYYESFAYSRGDFVAVPEFQAQFPGKNIADEFRLERDIDGLAGATMTSFGITRGARNAARQVAQAYLGFQEGDAQLRQWEANARAQLDKLSWQNLVDQGIVRQMTMPTLTGEELQLSVTYMGRKVLGEYLIGEEDYTRAERDASIRLGGNEMILLAVGGSGARMYRQHLLYLQQGDSPPRPVNPRRFVTAGNADAGAIAGNAAYAGAIVLEEDFDVTQPFSVQYKPQGSTEPFSVEYQISGLGLSLARNEPILSPEEIQRAAWAEAGYLTLLWNDPPWGETPWFKVLMLLAIFSLVMTAFLRKDSRARWAALGVTLIYLGFIDGGFLSVSHITGTIAQGPGIFLNNLPMLMIVSFTLVTTLLWGRIFCSSLCPFGALQDFIARFSPKKWQIKVPRFIHDRAIYIKYAILALIVGTALVQSNISIFQYFEPFGTLFFFSASTLLWAILIVFLIASIVIERFYCRYVCPLGAALGVVSLLSPLRIKRVSQCGLCKVCEHACPTGAIRGAKIDFKECVRCDICEIKLINKAGTCRHSMEEIGRRQKDKAQPVKIIDLMPGQPA